MPLAYEPGNRAAKTRAKQLRARRNAAPRTPAKTVQRHRALGAVKTPYRGRSRQQAASQRRIANAPKGVDVRHPVSARQVQRRARAKFDNPVKNLQHSERRAISAFSELRSQDPKGYDRQIKHAQEGPLRHTLRAAGTELQKDIGKSAEFLKRRVEKGSTKLPGQQQTAGVGSPEGAKEVIDIAANAPASLYLAGAAGYEAAKGRPHRAKKLWKDYKKTSAIPAALSGNWKEAEKRAIKHPISTGLELSGGKAVLGRGAGALARSGRLGAASKRAGSTERENLRLYPHARPGEGPEVRRTYSKDIINKGLQRAAERRAAKGSIRGRKTGTQRRPPRDPNVDQGSLLVPATLRRHGGAREATQPVRSRLLRRVDTREFQKNQIVNEDIHASANAAHDALSHAKRKHAPAVQMVVEGAVRTSNIRAGLHRELLRLTRERKGLTGERLRLNREQAKHIRELRNLSDKDLARVHAASEDYAAAQRPIQAEGDKLGVWDQTAQSKRFFPAVQSRQRRTAGEAKAKGIEDPQMAAVVLKKIRQRLDKGKPVGPKARAAYERARREQPDLFPREPHITTTHGNFSPEGLRPTGMAQAIARANAHREGIDLRPELGPIRDPRAAATSPSRASRRLDQDLNARFDAKRARGREAALADVVANLRRRVRTPGGAKLTEEELATAAKVLQRRQRRGQATLSDLPEGGPTLVTQRPTGRRVAGQPPRPIPGTPGKERSGTAFEQGAREVGQDALMRQAAESARTVSLEKNKRLIDEELGVPAGEKGRYAKTREEAQRVGELLTHDAETGELLPGQYPMIPVEIGRNRWLNLPEDVLHRMEGHAAIRAPHDPTGLGPIEAASNMWKNVVLTTAHPSQWLASNAADLAMRAAFEGLTPFDALRGHKVIKAAEATGTQGRQAGAAVARGGLFHTAEQAGRAGGIRPVLGHGKAASAKSIAGTPWRAWRNTIYRVEGALEALPQMARVGKAMRQETGRNYMAEDGAMKRDMASLLKLHRAQADHFGQRLGVDRALEAQVQKGVEDVVGRWGKVSPAMRKALGLAPFAQWLGAATRYVLITLPVHHPIKTGIMAGISEMTEPERRRMGLSYFLPRDKQVSDYQMGTVPIKTSTDKYGSLVTQGPRLGRMFSFGTAAEAAAGNVESFLFPQASGPLAAGAGRAFTGEQLKYPQDWPIKSERGLPLSPEDRRKVALGLGLESLLPFGTMFRNMVLEQGRPSDPTSSILTPHTRPVYNKEKDAWEQRPSDFNRGLAKWARPFPDPYQRLYPLGVSQQIEEAGATRRTLDRWKKLPKKAKGYGFGGGSSAKQSYGFDKPKAARSPKATPTATPYGF